MQAEHCAPRDSLSRCSFLLFCPRQEYYQEERERERACARTRHVIDTIVTTGSNHQIYVNTINETGNNEQDDVDNC